MGRSGRGPFLQVVQEVNQRLDATLPRGEVKLLVRAVSVIIGEREPCEDGVDPEDLLQLPDCGYASAAAAEDGFLAPHGLEGPRQGADAGGVAIGERGGESLPFDDLPADRRRSATIRTVIMASASEGIAAFGVPPVTQMTSSAGRAPARSTGM